MEFTSEIKKDLIERALEARKNAYVPYSNFHVGAAFLCADGRIYTGCNIENASYPVTLCAERTAMSKAISEGQRDFLLGAVVGDTEEICTPCGMCRQFISEFAPHMIILCGNNQGKYVEYTVDQLLPGAFNKDSM